MPLEDQPPRISTATGPHFSLEWTVTTATGDRSSLWFTGIAAGQPSPDGKIWRCFLGQDCLSTSDAWQQATTMPTPRFLVGMRCFNGLLWTVGGKTVDNQPSGLLEAYDPVEELWITKASLNVSRIRPIEFVDSSGNWNVIGGLDGSGQGIDSREQYDFTNNTWRIIPVSTPPIKLSDEGHDLRQCVLNDKLYLYLAKSFYAFDMTSGIWETLDGLPGTDGAGPISVRHSSIIMFGRVLQEERVGQLDGSLYEYNVDSKSWSPFAENIVPRPIGGTLVALDNGNAIIYHMIAGHSDFEGPEKEDGLDTIIISDPALDPTAAQRLNNSARAFYTLDKTYADFYQPARAIFTTGHPTFVERWDGRYAAATTDSFSQLLIPNVGLDWGSSVQAFTISLWVKAESFSSPVIIFRDIHSVFAMATTSGLQLSFENEIAHVNVPPFQAQKWYHFAFVFQMQKPNSNLVTVTTYVNALQVDLRTTPFNPQPLVNATLGHGNQPVVQYCNLAVFDLAASATDVKYLCCDLFHPEGAFAGTVQYKALTPNGTGMTASDDPLFELADGTGLTISAWIDTDDIDLEADFDPDEDALDSAPLIFRREGDYVFGMVDGVYPFVISARGQASETIVRSPVPVGDTKWCLISASITKSAIVLFIDGVQVAQSPRAVSTPPDKTVVSLCDGWITSVYSIFVMRGALTDSQIKAIALMDDEIIEARAETIVYYDLSTSPPQALSPVPTLNGPLVAPPGSSYEEYARGLMLNSGSFLDGGYSLDTTLGQDNLVPAIVFSVWLSPSDNQNFQTVFSRYSFGTSGYGLHLLQGQLQARIDIDETNQLVVTCPFIIPTKRFTQVAVIFGVDDQSNGVYASIFVNGSNIASGSMPTNIRTLGDRNTPFLIGVSRTSDTESGQPKHVDGFFGVIQSLQIFKGQIPDIGALFFQPQTITADPVGNWVFNGVVPIDLAGNHDSILRGGATIADVSAPQVPINSATRSNFKARYVEATRDVQDIEIPFEYRHILELDPADPRLFRVHQFQGVTYVIAHDMGDRSRGRCVLASGDIDPVTALWAAVAVAAIETLGILFDLKLNAGKAYNVVLGGFVKADKLRKAVYVFSAVTLEGMPGAMLALLKVLYEVGLMRQILSCFSLSWYSILKFLGYLAPYAGQIILAEQLIEMAAEMYKAFNESARDRKTDLRPPSPQVGVDRNSITVNGDPVRFLVHLDGPPDGAFVDVICFSLNMTLDKNTLRFSKSNYGTDQVVSAVRSSENALAEEDGKLLTATFSTPTGQCSRDLSQVVACIKLEPSEVNMYLDEEGENYTGRFEITLNHDIPETPSLSYAYEIDGKPLAETDYKIKEVDEGRKGAPKRKILEVSTPAGDDSKTKKPNLRVRATTAVPKQPADQTVANGTLNPIRDETIDIAMIDGRWGNCFIIRNEASYNDGKKDKTAYSVIDGGVRGTYPRMVNFLPGPDRDKDAQIDVHCSHFDADHIAGLLTLMKTPDMRARVRSVFFNPPPGNLTTDLDVLSSKVLKSVRQGRELATLASGNLISPLRATPSVPFKLDAAQLPSLNFLLFGPSPENWQKFSTKVSKSDYSKLVNRNSLGYLISSTKSAFTFMQTGDGYDSDTYPDLQGGMIKAPNKILDMLQVQHHGSRNNSSEAFFRKYQAKAYLFSTNFTQFRHPHQETINYLATANAGRLDDWFIFINASSDQRVAISKKLDFSGVRAKVFLRSVTADAIRFSYTKGALIWKDEDVVQIPSGHIFVR